MRQAAPLLVAAALALGLAGAYAALGGGSYKPVAVADPCAQRQRAGSGGVSGGIESVVLSALDGAACTLGVSREELVLALRSEEAFDSFSAEHGIERDEAEQAIHDGLVSAVDEAEEDGTLPGFVAPFVRKAAEEVSPWLILETLERLGDFLS
jgi:hypothetical protein